MSEVRRMGKNLELEVSERGANRQRHLGVLRVETQKKVRRPEHGMHFREKPSLRWASRAPRGVE